MEIRCFIFLLARNLQHLQVLEEVEDLAFNILLSIIVVAWAATAACRTCLWSLLYGRQTWNFLNSIRTVCRLNLLTHLMELCGYLTLLALMLILAGHGLSMWELNQLKLQQELFAEIQLLMLAPLSAIFPSSVILIQMLQAPPIPARTRACGMCCRLKKWQWAWFFCFSVFWHALASIGALISVILPLNSIGNLSDRPGFELAMRQCRQEMLGLCQTTDWRQVPDTRWENHLKCALDCSDVKIPAEDVVLHFYSTAYKLLALCSSCSLLSKSFLLWISCRILKIARRTVQHSKTTNASSETQPERAAAEAAEPQATLAAVPGVSGNANEAVLTPSLFQQGAVSVRTPRTPRSQREAMKSLEVAQEDKVENGDGEENLELSDEGKIRQQQVLEAAMSLPQPPSPNGSVASLNFKPQATAAEIRKMLENPLADGHAELVDFAKSIARECTKDSATSNGSASSSRSRRARG